MTTLCALFAGVSLVFGTGTGSEFRQPLGYVMVGGLIVSQLLTLPGGLYLHGSPQWVAYHMEVARSSSAKGACHTHGAAISTSAVAEEYPKID
jgi:hypothetical protein